MKDEIRQAKIADLTQALGDTNRALALIPEGGRDSYEAIIVALHRIGALVIELAQERHDCGDCHGTAGREGVVIRNCTFADTGEVTTPERHPANTGLARPGDAPRVRAAKRRK